MNQTRFTQEGLEKVQQELENLIKERPEAVEDLQKARALGDLSENGFYKGARAKLSSIDSRIRRLRILLNNAIIAQPIDKNVIGIGRNVTLKNEKEQVTYSIVGDIEADPINHKISLLSPIGKAIHGKKLGDQVTVITPSKKLTYTIIKID